MIDLNIISYNNDPQKYDFILFENAYSLENHYKDLELFALALKKAGYNVAIANIFKEKALCKNSEIPHISLKRKASSHLTEQKVYRDKVSSLRYAYLRFLSNIYLLYAIFSLRKKTKSFYIGSLTIDTPIFWLLFLPNKNHYYIWGLRSYVILKWKERFCERYGIYSFLLYLIIRFITRIRLVVSNSIIKEEFAKIINKPQSRLIVRSERWISNDYIIKPKTDRVNKTIFLTIGTLRRNKHVEVVLSALKLLGDDNVEYIIAGRCKDDNGYNEMIESCIKGMYNVQRINRFIPQDEYEELFYNADFLILCDEPEKTCGTNGTMLEALLMGCPVIAPNHEPFISEIKNNNVGLLYDLKDPNTLCGCIREAVLKGPSYFEMYIRNYIRNLCEDKVVYNIREQVKCLEE